ncbi:MAG: flagellar regulator YcgR PilZN domain-containing protein [Telluria sp.]
MQAMGNLQLHDWHEFALTSRREIAALLGKICESQARILVAVRGQPATWVTGIACNANGLVFDRALTAEHNESIVKARHISFETSLDNIRIFFEAGKVRPVEYDGMPAFVIDLPDEVVRLQRREFYRVPTPLTEPVMVSIAVPTAAGSEAINFSLADISCGGIGLLDNQSTLGATVGRTYAQCRINLPEIGTITTGLQLRNAMTMTLLNDRTNRRLGCQFIGISTAHLSMVQRYVNKRECERKGQPK